MSDERRERYAAAMAGYMGHIPEVDGPIPESYYPVADAAMAVADEELSARANTVSAYWECQAARYRDHAANLEQKVIDMGGYQLAAESLVAENARLRAELDAATRHLDERHNAAIERVRAALNSRKVQGSWDVVADIRAALDGTP
ncbi:hypothetical protein ACWCO0_09600 [Streptomyces tubercidicus]